MATLVMIATSPGQTFGFSFFNPHIRQALSLSRTQLSAAYLVATLLASLPLAYLGGLSDKFGMRRVLLIAVAVMAAACALAASVQNVAMLFATFFIMRMVGPGLMTLLANNTLAAWFDRRLGVASGAMQLGMAGAIAVVPAGFYMLINTIGWRQAYLAMGAALAVGLLPLLWFVYRQSPSDVGQWPDGRAPDEDDPSLADPSMSAGSAHGISGYANSLSLDEAIRTRSYWILLAATGAWALIGTGLVFHMQAVFTSRGLDEALAAWAPTAMAIGMAAMQITGGILADRIGVRWLVVMAMSGIAAGCSVVALSSGLGLLLGYAVYGLAQGVMTIVAGTAWARYFGRAHLGRIRGTAVTAAVGSSSAGPLIMGASSDYLGGFEPSMWVFVAGAAALAVAGFWATPPALPSRDA